MKNLLLLVLLLANYSNAEQDRNCVAYGLNTGIMQLPCLHGGCLSSPMLDEQFAIPTQSFAIPLQNKVTLGLSVYTAFSILLFSTLALAYAYWRERLQRQRLRSLVYIDHLTSVYNRRYLFQLGNRLLKRCLSGGESFAVIMLDVDHFKQLNDSYGHNAGDILLTQIAEICQTESRPSDIVGRYGGEEFLLLLPNTQIQAAKAVAERIRRKISELSLNSKPKMNLNKEQPCPKQISASFGISCSCKKHPHSFDILIHQADQAMYQAKAAGRNTVHY